MRNQRKQSLLTYAAIILGGLVLGLVLRGHMTPPPDRAVAALGIFEQICVPFSQEGKIDVGRARPDLVALARPGMWGDPESKVSLVLRERNCEVSDILLRFTHEEREWFETLATDMVPGTFPDLAVDDSHGMKWDAFMLWTQFDWGDAQRWGVTLTRVAPMEVPDAAGDALSTTRLSVRINARQ